MKSLSPPDDPIKPLPCGVCHSHWLIPISKSKHGIGCFCKERPQFTNSSITDMVSSWNRIMNKVYYQRGI